MVQQPRTTVTRLLFITIISVLCTDANDDTLVLSSFINPTVLFQSMPDVTTIGTTIFGINNLKYTRNYDKPQFSRSVAVMVGIKGKAER
jgi:hypothetical protein